MTKRRSPLFIIFTTVFLDLIGFGIVIPLIAIYGKHFGASGWTLALLGGIYSLMQFVFAPYWGGLSDRIGRRPVLLISLAGSTLSYALFAVAQSVEWLFVSRLFGGVFAANISAAQAYIADITKPEERAKGMGLIGAAFGIGFMLGPPLGGLSAAKWGLWAPGAIAATICGLNFLAAVYRLPESLAIDARARAMRRSLSPINFQALTDSLQHPFRWGLILIFFIVTFSFSQMEQTFSLLLQSKFALTTQEAALKTGLILMWTSLWGAVIQGGLIRKLVPRFGERRLLYTGLALQSLAIVAYPWMPSYESYYAIGLLFAIGTSIAIPSLYSMISRSANSSEQGAVMGLSASVGSLARAAGPFLGLVTFEVGRAIPYQTAGVLYLFAFVFALILMKRSGKEFA